TLLPGEVRQIECRTVEDVWEAIGRLRIRGAPAIGCAAAYGVCVGVQSGKGLDEVCDYLATSRPTAVNLFWALERMREAGKRVATSQPGQLAEALLAEARAIHEEDREMCAAIGRHGADLLAELPAGSGILTHCNTGALATGGDGTALSVVFELARRGMRPHVWVDETRPLLQGARLTAWELMQRDVDCTLICDSTAGAVMRSGRVQAVVTGADRIAANGDVANKIGTYGIAVLAQAHGIPFYVAAPTSTFDPALATGVEIPIEQRPAEEITRGFGLATAPADAKVYNPAFDVTPAELIARLITERSVVLRPDTAGLASLYHHC
ncbi:MAG: S-methyl-5-thioribose-1-phosphate isomerase, partial [Planctomycetes bacterium]|nr:S-methyl-5-thioribose-1-phosphate isomerase [Planctomycetota bacterium]